MRIIGHIGHSILKITVFKTDNKFSVKFESNLFEQTYKFRESDRIASLEDIQRLVDDDFIDSVLEIFKNMNSLKNKAMQRNSPEIEGDDFEEIV